MSREQREYLLRQQLRAIQEELGEKNPEKAEVEELRERLDEADLPDEVRKEAERELGRLERLPAAAPDYQLTRTYLELILELPWRRTPPTCSICPCPPGARRGPLRSGGDQGAHPRAPGRPEAQSRSAGADPVLCRAARRRQDLAGPVDCPRHGPQVRAHQPGRPARRGRAARPSPHLYWRHAGPDHPGHPPRRRQQSGADAGRGRQAGPRLPRRPGGGAPGNPRPGPEHHLSATTTSTCRSTCRRSFSSPPPTRSTPFPGPCWTAWRSSGCPATAKRRKSRSPAATCSAPAHQAGLTAEQLIIPDETLEAGHQPLHARGGRAEAGADAGPGGAQGGTAFRQGNAGRHHRSAGRPGRVARPGAFLPRAAQAVAARRGHRPGLDRGGGDVLYVEATSCRTAGVCA